MRTRIPVGAMTFSAGLLLAAQASNVRATEPAGEGQEPEPSTARLLIDRAVVEPGATFELGVLISLAKGWHTYADPPGDSGMAPILDLQLPAGFTVAPLRYPPHREFKDEAGTTYGFESAVLLRVPVHVAADARPGATLQITGNLEYLICRDVCVPRSAELKSNVRIGATSTPDNVWRRALSDGGWQESRNKRNREVP